MVEPLDQQELAALAEAFPTWHVTDTAVSRVIEAPTFNDAIALVVAIAEIAEEMDHHPDIDIRWRRLTVRASTHSAGNRVTDLDVGLVEAIEALLHPRE